MWKVIPCGYFYCRTFDPLFKFGSKGREINGFSANGTIDFGVWRVDTNRYTRVDVLV